MNSDSASCQITVVFVVHLWSGCPQAPGRPECKVNGRFVVLKWQKAAVLPGDSPTTHYIVQAKQLVAGINDIVYFVIISIHCQFHVLAVFFKARSHQVNA